MKESTTLDVKMLRGMLLRIGIDDRRSRTPHFMH